MARKGKTENHTHGNGGPEREINGVTLEERKEVENIRR